MTIPTFNDLVQDVTEESALATIDAAGLVVGLDFNAMSPENPYRALAHGVVPIAIANAFESSGPAIRAGFLDLAEGGWLQRTGYEQFGTEYIGETFATPSVTLTNTSPNLYIREIGQHTVKNVATNKTYTNTERFELQPAGDPDDSATIVFIAEEAGTASNAQIGDISANVTTLDGVTVTNAAPASATDNEDEDAYRTRCRRALAATSPDGPADAYAYIATSARRTDGSAIGITRVYVDADGIFGEVTVWVSDADGTIAGADLTRLDALLLGTATDEYAILPNGTRSGAVPLTVNYVGCLAADTVTVPVTYTAEALASAGLTAPEIEALVEEALTDLMASVPINGWNGVLAQSKIAGAIAQTRKDPADPDLITSVTVSLPAADVDLAPPATASPSIPILGSVTPTITLI